MKSHIFWQWLPLLFQTSWWSVASGPADAAWSTRSYQLALPEVESGFTSSEGQEMKAPPVPKGNAPEAEIKKFLEESNAVLTAYFRAPKTLEALGPIEFPKGTLLAYDADTAGLTVRSQCANHRWLKDLCTFRGPPIDLPLRHHLQIVEADAPLIRKAIEASLTLSDHRSILASLEREISLGHGVRCCEAIVITKTTGGDRVECGKEREYASGFRWEDGKLLQEIEMRRAGLGLEVYPAWSSAGEFIDLSITIKHHFGPPVRRVVPLHIGKEETWQLPLTDFQTMDFKTNLRQKPGVLRLIGVWSPQKFGLPDVGAKLQAGFLTVDVEQGPMGDQLTAWLGKYGEALPTTPSPLPNSERWLFAAYARLPGGYLHKPLINPASQAQPTYSDNTSNTLPTVLGPPPAALECLTDFVEKFPEGSDANFLPGSSLVSVRTSRDCLRKLDEVLSDFGVSDVKTEWTDQLACSLEIIQADGAVLRELMAKHSANDPAGLHQALEAAIQDHRALLVEAAQMDTRKGSECKLEASLEQIVLSVGQPTKPSAEEPEEKAKAAKAGMPIGGTARRAGLTWQLRTGFATERKTLEMDCEVEYHYAPPMLQPATLELVEGLQPTNASSTDFHNVRFKSSISITPGQYHLIGLWKPTGAPAFDGKDILQVAFIRVHPSMPETPP
jgi:hypothetical protein